MIPRGALIGAAALVGPRVVRALRAARRAPGRAFVLMYHRVSPEPNYLGLAVHPAQFAAHLELVLRRTRVVRLQDLVERVCDPTPLERDWAAVTFDDGYRDNLEIAEPILARFGVPGTVFVTTDFIDRTDFPLPDRLERGLRTLWQRGVRPERWPDSGDEPTDRSMRRALARPGDWGPLRVVTSRVERDPAARHAALEGLARLGGGRAADPSPMLAWDDVRELAARGVEIGSHTISHSILSCLPPTEAEGEIGRSKERIEAQLQRPVLGLAFPYGTLADFTSGHVACAGRTGYRYACTTVRGGNVPGSDVFRLRRLGVGRHPATEVLDLKLALGGPPQPLGTGLR